ncbi:LOW QUALITY PROTEIN: hypothetical protein V1478_010325 [Vespula squamosa]|uniref:Transmembrane protein n=1 Tax=Vespula squamosa TaxID=30214 RepID=A0ABD2AHG0_VESSQ
MWKFQLVYYANTFFVYITTFDHSSFHLHNFFTILFLTPKINFDGEQQIQISLPCWKGNENETSISNDCKPNTIVYYYLLSLFLILKFMRVFVPPSAKRRAQKRLERIRFVFLPFSFMSAIIRLSLLQLYQRKRVEMCYYLLMQK